LNFDRGQIFWIDGTPEKADKEANRRPALILSPSAYNAISSCALVFPITSNISPWPWKVILPEKFSMSGAILVDQLKTINIKVLNPQDSGIRIPQAVMDEVMARLSVLVS
jgi:mRNA interferase MazF